MTPSVEIRGLRKEFRSGRRPPIVAIHDLDFTLARGEIVAVMGPNGAGKTTLLKILATLITPTEGHVEIEGIPLDRGLEIRRLVGLLTSDERSFYWRLTGRQNLEFFAALHGLGGRDAAVRIEGLAGVLGMTDYLARRFSEYSSGMKQSLALARSLLHNPSLLLLDEPTRSLDEASTRRLFEHLRAVGRSEGRSVLVVTHHTEEAKSLCDRVVRLEKGAVVATEVAP